GLFQRQPFDGLDIVHRLAHGPPDDSHIPELYDLDPAIDRVQNPPEKTVDGKPGAGFFQHPSPGRTQRVVPRIETAPWHGPRLCPFAIARLRCAVWRLSLRQFRPRPGSAVDRSHRIEDSWRSPRS